MTASEIEGMIIDTGVLYHEFMDAGDLADNQLWVEYCEKRDATFAAVRTLAGQVEAMKEDVSRMVDALNDIGNTAQMCPEPQLTNDGEAIVPPEMTHKQACEVIQEKVVAGLGRHYYGHRLDAAALEGGKG